MRRFAIWMRLSRIASTSCCVATCRVDGEFGEVVVTGNTTNADEFANIKGKANKAQIERNVHNRGKREG